MAHERFRKRSSAPTSLLVALDVGGDAFVKPRGGGQHGALVFVLADEGGDLVEFGHPAIGLAVHRGRLPRQPAEQRLLAFGEFGLQRLGRAFARGGQHHGGASAVKPLVMPA